MVNITIKLQGSKELKAGFNDLEKNIRTKVMKRVMKKAVEPVLKTAKQTVSVRYGFLKEVLDTGTRQKSSAVVTGIVGANSKQTFILKGHVVVGIKKGKKTTMIKKNANAKGKEKRIRPSRYLHLVEKKTRFLSKALTANASAAQAIVEKEITTEILKAHEQIAKKAKAAIKK